MAMPPIPSSRVGRLFALLGLVALGGLVASALSLGEGVAEAQTTNCPSFSHQPGDTDPEVIIGTTATRLPALCARRGMAIQNLGASTLWCTSSGVAAHARVNRSWRIASGEAWALDAKDTQPIWCVSESAQAQGAATIVMELR